MRITSYIWKGLGSFQVEHLRRRKEPLEKNRIVWFETALSMNDWVKQTY